MGKFAYRIAAFVGAVLIFVGLYALERRYQDEKTSATTPLLNEVAETRPSATPPPVILKGDEILEAPAYYLDLPKIIKTNHKGEARVAWTPVPGAKGYVVVIFDRHQRVLKTYYTAWHVIYLKDVPIDSGASGAKYLINVATVNARRKRGLYGPPRRLHVRPLTNIVAPQIRQIRVED